MRILLSFKTSMLLFVLIISGCNTNSALTPSTSAKVANSSKGYLKTSVGKSFRYTYQGAQQPSVTVIYVTGMGGNGTQIAPLSRYFTAAGQSLITFDRREPRCSNSSSCKKGVARRSANSSVMFKGADGSPSATEDILEKEISSILAFAETTPTYSPEKGIVLIGGSYGAWLSLKTVERFPNKPIKGVVFLSPAVLEQWVTPPQARPDMVQNHSAAIAAFGDRKALAIGGAGDLIAPKLKGVENASALDSAKFLVRGLGSNATLYPTSSRAHSVKLILGNSNVRNKIIQWIGTNFGS